MKNQRDINMVMLTFALTTMMWVFTFSVIIGKLDKTRKAEIELIKQECK